jgi:hypothetical protein
MELRSTGVLHAKVIVQFVQLLGNVAPQFNVSVAFVKPVGFEELDEVGFPLQEKMTNPEKPNRNVKNNIKFFSFNPRFNYLTKK